MKSTKLDIPIYCSTLTIILDSDLKYVEKKYKTIPLDDFGAVTLKDEKKYRHYVVAFTDANHTSNVVHEIVHIKNQIYLDCAMQLDRHNDEPEAYLTGFLFEKIEQFLNKHKSNVK